MSKSAGSLDDIMNIVDTLDESGMAYVLMIGRQEEGVTRVYGNAHLFEVEGKTEDGRELDGMDSMDVAWKSYVELRDKEREAEDE